MTTWTHVGGVNVTMKRWLLSMVGGAVMVLGACSDRGGGSVAFDGSPPQKDTSAYLERFAICTADYQCLSGHCATFASGERRCSTSCKGPEDCPALTGWSCDTPHEVCVCAGKGAKPDECNVDGDCDGKADRAVGPEICDDKDNDCNGIVDDVPANAAGAKLYYVDSDGDGYGDARKSAWRCKPLAGWVLDASDCNDAEKSAHPGATEICGDMIDNDCDLKIEDTDVCGLTPPSVPDLSQGQSARLTACDLDGSISASFDVTELVAKQDMTLIKFTMRLRGGPETQVCATYKLTLGSATSPDDVVYIYRPALIPCQGATPSLPSFEAYAGGVAFTATSKAVTGFNAANPGHISFTVPKAEIFGRIPDPSYQLRACTNAIPDAVKDKTACATDSCTTPVHR
ncbi:MAG: putative metal-binding motif-containing protein [Deltaproteobacteria bacterium]|nr:putative metal-binding motif-containing protein [Deltaproteobacteria bacterium]